MTVGNKNFTLGNPDFSNFFKISPVGSTGTVLLWFIFPFDTFQVASLLKFLKCIPNRQQWLPSVNYTRRASAALWISQSSLELNIVGNDVSRLPMIYEVSPILQGNYQFCAINGRVVTLINDTGEARPLLWSTCMKSRDSPNSNPNPKRSQKPSQGPVRIWLKKKSGLKNLVRLSLFNKMILISVKSGVILLDRTERWRTWRRNATRPRPTGTFKGLNSGSGTRGRSGRSSRRGRDQREGPKADDRAPGIKPVVGEDKAQGEGGTKDDDRAPRRGPEVGGDKAQGERDQNSKHRFRVGRREQS